MNGTLYQDIAGDLASTPKGALADAQLQKASRLAVDTYQQQVGGQLFVSNQQATLMVYVDGANKAHWAYLVKFDVAPPKPDALPARPVYLLDAVTLQAYQQWDEIQTAQPSANEIPVDLKRNVKGGGFGGNLKMGKRVYDGLNDDMPVLNLMRDIATQNCSLENKAVMVQNYNGRVLESFNCKKRDAEHNYVFWNGDQDAVNGGYSPANDALFCGAVIKDMYRKWYDVDVLTEAGGRPMLLKMVVHARMDNAYWDGKQMTFGDGISMFYPLTSLGVAAHEVSHGFTEQHAGLVYSGQSGGMNESFSDMASKAAEFYAYGSLSDWDLGGEIVKEEGRALRYLDQPSKDCYGKTPRNYCSIDKASQYHAGLDVHHSSGVYNRLFYLISTAKGWDVKKAFDVMVNANQHYWTPTTTFNQGACGVLLAAKSLGYDSSAILQALELVEINASQ